MIRAGAPEELDAIVAIDDDAAELYARHGLHLLLPPSHPFTAHERARWLESARSGLLFVSVDEQDAPLGFAALERVDGAAYLDQLAVRMHAMRRGLGRSLLRHAIDWARAHGHAELWLTTYAHLPFNRPFYEREGFAVVPDSECGPGMRRHLDEQRGVLPLPDERVAMKRRV